MSHLSLTISEFNSISNRGIFPERIGIHLQQIIPNTLCMKIQGKKCNRTTVITPIADRTQKSCYKTLSFITALILHLYYPVKNFKVDREIYFSSSAFSSTTSASASSAGSSASSGASSAGAAFFSFLGLPDFFTSVSSASSS